MIRQLEVVHFKSLREVQVNLESLTILIGANASGKTNLLDVIRFLQGVGNGLTVQEILDGRRGDATLRQWDGIRGGSQEVLYRPPDGKAPPDFLQSRQKNDRQKPWDAPGCLGIKVTLDHPATPSAPPLTTTYALAVDPGHAAVREEWLEADNPPVEFLQWSMFSTNESDATPLPSRYVYDTRFREQNYLGPVLRASLRMSDRRFMEYASHQPILSQFRGSRAGNEADEEVAARCASALANVQFLNVSLDELRRYVRTGVRRLGDHGENFASVVHAILQEPGRKQGYLSWLQELTPTRIEDIDLFTAELGDVLFGVREDGVRLSARSLSDGTLRFAALAAALLGPEPPATLLVEEIENGVHPTRLRLVLELLHQVSQSGQQIIVTTHSPLVLAYLPPERYKNVLFVYRSPDDGSTHVKPLPQVPYLMEVLQRRPVDDLFATGWLEEAV
jgi:hypothetical protein